MPMDSRERKELDMNAFIQQLAEKLPAYRETLGLSATEIETLKANARTFNYLISFTPPLAADRLALYDYKNEMYYGEIGSVPVVPVIPDMSTALVVEGGIIKWVESLVRRIRSSEGYTIEIGRELGLPDPARLKLFEYKSLDIPD
ncbi:MAG: hypothetical protein KF762_17850 [Acidobacteria bacterium]|nr:hypothetical protein [Acidobacteriota bacterium]